MHRSCTSINKTGLLQGYVANLVWRWKRLFDLSLELFEDVHIFDFEGQK